MDKQIVVKDPNDEVLVREILLFVVHSIKRRIGFDAEDVLLHLSGKGVKTSVDVVERSLDEMVDACILEKFHSTDRDKMIYCSR